MRVELENQLSYAYPKIFRQIDLPMQQTCMCWGFECGDGWYNIIDNLCREIQNRCDFMGFQVEAVQVKEKFGTLRFYISGGDDEIYKMIDIAELASGKTCEICGEPGKLRGTGWLSTLCDGCANKKGLPLCVPCE